MLRRYPFRSEVALPSLKATLLRYDYRSTSTFPLHKRCSAAVCSHSFHTHWRRASSLTKPSTRHAEDFSTSTSLSSFSGALRSGGVRGFATPPTLLSHRVSTSPAPDGRADASPTSIPNGPSPVRAAVRLHVVHPDLLDEWVPEMNEEDVHSLTSASTQPVVWRCRWCDHVYSCSPSRRVQLRALACPECKGRGLPAPPSAFPPLASAPLEGKGSAAVAATSGSGPHDATENVPTNDLSALQNASSLSFAEACPHLVRYWDVEANGSLSPSQVPVHSTMSIWWKYPVLRHFTLPTSWGGDASCSASPVAPPLPTGGENGEAVRWEYFSRPLCAFVQDPLPMVVKQRAKAILEVSLLRQMHHAKPQPHPSTTAAASSSSTTGAGKAGEGSPALPTPSADAPPVDLGKDPLPSAPVRSVQEGKKREAPCKKWLPANAEVCRSVFLEDWQQMMAHMKVEVQQWYSEHQHRKEGRTWGGGEGEDGDEDHPHTAASVRDHEEGEGGPRRNRREKDGVSIVLPHSTTVGENSAVHPHPKAPLEAEKERMEGNGSVPSRRVFIPRSVLASALGPHCRDFFLFGGATRRLMPHRWTTVHQRPSPSLSSSASASVMVREERQKEQQQLFIHEKVRELALTMYVHAARCRYQALEPRFSASAIACVAPPAILGVDPNGEDEHWTRFFHPTRAQASAVLRQLSERLRHAQKEEEGGKEEKAWGFLYALSSSAAPSVSSVGATAYATHRMGGGSVVDRNDPATSKQAGEVSHTFSAAAELVMGDLPTGTGEDVSEAEVGQVPLPSVRVPFPLPPFLDASYSEGLEEGAKADYAKIASARGGAAFDEERRDDHDARLVREATTHADLSPPPRHSSASSSTATWMHQALSGNKGRAPGKDGQGRSSMAQASTAEDSNQEEKTHRAATPLEDDPTASSSSSIDAMVEKEFTAELRQSRGREIADIPSSSSESDGTEMKQYLKMRRSVERESPESLLNAYQRPSPPMKERGFGKPSFRLRLPRGNPSGMVQYGSTQDGGKEKNALSSSSASLTPMSGGGSSVSHPSSASVFEAPRTPRKVARPKRSSPLSEPEEKK